MASSCEAVRAVVKGSVGLTREGQDVSIKIRYPNPKRDILYVFQVEAGLCSPGKDAPTSEAKLASGEDLSPRDLEGG